MAESKLDFLPCSLTHSLLVQGISISRFSLTINIKGFLKAFSPVRSCSLMSVWEQWEQRIMGLLCQETTSIDGSIFSGA